MKTLKSEKDSNAGKFIRDSYFYLIEGDPIPLARARHGNRRTWDAQKQLKLVIGLSLEEQHGDRPLLSKPLLIDVLFYFPIPDSYGEKKRQDVLGKPHSFKPDLSNLIKFIEDVATGILYEDDSLIAFISAKKLYDTKPRTELFITEL